MFGKTFLVVGGFFLLLSRFDPIRYDGNQSGIKLLILGTMCIFIGLGGYIDDINTPTIK
tara:strand:+ start:95 stop:271 length:177 start_codon:yes stop_codon:yes gene_type:complete